MAYLLQGKQYNGFIVYSITLAVGSMTQTEAFASVIFSVISSSHHKHPYYFESEFNHGHYPSHNFVSDYSPDNKRTDLVLKHYDSGET